MTASPTRATAKPDRGFIWLAAAAVGGGVVAAEPRLAVLGGAASLVALTWRWPRVVVGMCAFAVLALRPTLDVFSERRLGLGPFTSNPAVVIGLCVLVAATVIAIKRGRDGHTIWPGVTLLRAHLWLIACYAVAAFSGALLYGTHGMGVGLRELARMASVVSAFLVVLWWSEDSPQATSLGWAYVILGGVVPVSFALWQLTSGQGNLDVAGLNRLQGTFSHPNTFGPFLVPYILLALGGVRASPPRGQLVRLVTAGALSVLVALTYSRTAVLVVLVALITFPVLQAPRFGPRALVGSALAAGVFGLFAWFLVGDLVVERFTGLRVGAEALDAVRTGEMENSLEWRLVTWSVLISYGMEHPATGHGAGMTTELNPIVNPESGLPFNAHNDFVRVFFEAGVLGLMTYVMYGLLIFRWSLYLARRVRPQHAPTAYAVAATLGSMFFFTGGVPEFGTQTALQCQVLGMLALVTGTQTWNDRLGLGARSGQGQDSERSDQKADRGA